ncbi:MAG: hypothetical protein P4L26_14275 [Terracidiphilus sp.]|nr:hypothetical protein [Terracidiphilus sp.]
MSSRLSRSLARLIVAVSLAALAVPQLGTPTVQAKDGTGLDKITWSGGIRVEMQSHHTDNTNSPDKTYTYSTNENHVTEYQVYGLPHDALNQWDNADQQIQVRFHEDHTGSEVSGGGHTNMHYEGNEDGSGATTGAVSLWIRGDGEQDSGHCRLEAGGVGDRSDGGQLTKSISTSRTEHGWGVSSGSPVNYTNNSTQTTFAQGVRLDFPCAKGAHFLSGSQQTEHSADMTERVTWSLHQDGDPQTEVELVPPDEYPQWMPQAGKDEKTIGNDIDVGIVAHTKGDPSLKPPKKVLKYTITLEDTSKEKGVDSNWPNPNSATTDFDMKIDPLNGWIKVADEKGQSAETKQEGLTEFKVSINSYDWGGSTKLKVIAELEGGQTVVAHVRGHTDQDFLSIPKDDNQNHIADYWEDIFGLKNADASADDDQHPLGDGHNGDSIALYDEYRGFHIGGNGKHERTSPETKDLFILDSDGLGAGIYEQATGVSVHLIKSTEWFLKGGANNRVVVTGNGTHGDVYAIYLVNQTLDSGDLGDTVGGPGVPRDIKIVKIDRTKILNGYGRVGADGLSAVIAHELGHATNIHHHGEAPPDYDTGDVRCKRPDGSFENHLCSEWAKDAGGKAVGLGEKAGKCYMVAAQGGSFSGNDQCLMRYDVADYYENANGNCQWKTESGKTVHGFKYGADPPGMTLCTSGKGTGVNDTSNPNNKAGNASPGQGECMYKFCLKNSAH